MYQCTYRWPGVGESKERFARFAAAFIAAEEATPRIRQMVRGWYGYPGEWAGFLLLEAASCDELADVLHQFTGLMQWEVKALKVWDYEQTRARFLATAQRP